MCFRFGSCFGSGSGQDYGRSTPKTTHGGGHSHRWGQPDHGGYYRAGADHRVPPVAANDGYNAGGVRKDHVDDAHGHGHGHAQDKAVDEAPKHPAVWSGKVGDDTDYHPNRTMNTTTATLAKY